jgi:integrin beta 5
MRSTVLWLWLWLCALELCLQPALPQIVAVNVPPEDQDGSGDDSDNFSGSSTGALPDTLSRQTPSTWKDMWLLTATPTAPEPTSSNTETAFASVRPAREKPKEGEPVLHVEAEPGFTTWDKEKEGTTRPRDTMQLPITQQASTVRVTTAQAAVTSHPHWGMQPGGGTKAATPWRSPNKPMEVPTRNPPSRRSSMPDGEIVLSPRPHSPCHSLVSHLPLL